jgi:hypothetical protein
MILERFVAAYCVERYRVTGSLAARMNGLDLGHLADIDIIVPYDFGIALQAIVPAPTINANSFHFLFEGTHIDISYADNESNRMLLAEGNGPLTLSQLAALKKAHRFFCKGGDHRKWHRHMSDYELLKSHYNESEDKLLELRTAETIAATPSHSVKLANGTKKSDFFSQYLDKITYFFEHDSVHLIVTSTMHGRTIPLYVGMLADGEEVKCDRRKWEAFSHDDKIKDVLEECYVIALERGIVPGIFGGTGFKRYDDAFMWAFMRVGTNLTKGWFREFANSHYREVMDAFYDANKRSSNYATKFLEAVDKGLIVRKQ